MTDKNLTEIICVVDRSGSMSSCWQDAVGGFDTFIKDQKEADIGECKLTLITFDNEYEVVYDGEPLDNVKSLKDICSPRGATALLDAVGTAIATVGSRLSKTPEKKRPGNVIMVILTDGGENASREFHHTAVKQMIDHQTEKYKWQFIFLAQNIEAKTHGGALGMQMSRDAHFVANAGAGGMGMQSAYKVASAVTVGTRTRGAMGQQVNCTPAKKNLYADFAMSSSVQDWNATSDALDKEIAEQKEAYRSFRAQQSEDSSSTDSSSDVDVDCD